MADTPLPSTLFAFIWHFIKQQKWRFLLLFFTPMLQPLESNVLPYALKLMVNTVTRLGNNTAEAFHVLAPPICLFLGAWLTKTVVWRTQEWVATYTFQQFRTDIRMSLFTYTQGHSHAYFSNHFAGSIANKISDVPRAAHTLIDLTRWQLMTTFWVVLVAIVWLATVSLQFAIVLAVWVTIHMAICYSLARKVNRCARKHAEDITALNGQVVDSITSISTARLFARFRHEQDYIGQWMAEAQESGRLTAVAMFKVRLAMDVPLLIMYIAMLFLLTRGWQAGWVTSGDMVFVMFTVFNVMGIIWRLGTELPNFFNEIGICEQALTLITRAHGIVDAPEAVPLIVKKGEIVFDNVHFHYIPGRDIFKDKNLVIQPGEKVGLVGFSGSGKSTFVNLILRFYDVESGRILIDGQDIATVTQDSLRASIAMIPQDSSLFHRTLMENIRYGRIDATDAEVIEASGKAHCHEFISQLDGGYESLVGERGIKLSGGQRQRIAIARAVLKNAPILILDEATSALDSITEKYIQESLNMLMENRTTIVIAHRLSTLAHMDRILIFKDGAISEDGTHQSLLAAGGHYARLWNMQAGGFLPEES